MENNQDENNSRYSYRSQDQKQEQVGYIVVSEQHATAWFKYATSLSLKERIDSTRWLQWRKNEDNGIVRWSIRIDLSKYWTNLDKFARMLSEEGVTVLIRKKHDQRWVPYNFATPKPEQKAEEKSGENTNGEEEAIKYFFYMKPSYFKELSDLAKEKHISFSTLIICACDAYLRSEKQAAPLKALDSSLPEGTFSEKVLMEIARRGSKRAWVADKLGLDRSRFYRMIETNKWTEEEKTAINNLFGWG